MRRAWAAAFLACLSLLSVAASPSRAAPPAADAEGQACIARGMNDFISRPMRLRLAPQWFAQQPEASALINAEFTADRRGEALRPAHALAGAVGLLARRAGA